jgi:hypothetical protein
MAAQQAQGVRVEKMKSKAAGIISGGLCLRHYDRSGVRVRQRQPSLIQTLVNGKPFGTLLSMSTRGQSPVTPNE